LLSLVRVLEWRAAVNPDAIALREPFWAGRDRPVS
jgi:hypothetical protein